jgi:hypothetical protein
MTNRRNATVALLALAFALGWGAMAQSKLKQPETVMVTLRAKPGSGAALQHVLAEHWATARKLNLVRAAPHVTLRYDEEGGKSRFVDIFTWRDAAIPDKAPAEIRALWDRMNSLVEARGGRPGLEFQEVSLVEP